MNYIQSYKDGKTKRKHRIIVEEYLGRNLTDDEIVHHIDGDKRNNSISNLIVVTRAEHARIHASGIDRSKPVFQLTLDGIFVKEWKSAREASRNLGIQSSNISHCCKGKINQAGGFIWKHRKTKTEDAP